MNAITHYYPPEVVSLLVDTIPLLCRSKQDVLTFFRVTEVPSELLADLAARVERDRSSVTKYEIVRTVWTRLEELGERGLGPKRRIIQRIVEWEDFSRCWPDDRLRALGLVSEVRRIVNVKDSFTRMKDEREAELRRHRAHHEMKLAELRRRREDLQSARDELFALFSATDPWKRGKSSEQVLNKLFHVSGILVRESFSLTGEAAKGIVEQIDGVVEIDGQPYLVEMKWTTEPLGRAQVSEHLVRVYHRAGCGGIFISAGGYTQAAIEVCKEALKERVVVLCTLEEVVHLLDRGEDFSGLLREKILAAIIDKNPLHRTS